MKVVGITGPAGAGKSSLARMLARRPGISRVDCDELAHASYRRGGPAYAPLVARFGEGILTPQGAVDRARLAQLVFSDPKAKADLEDIVHPWVMRALEEEIVRQRALGTRWLLVEGALLLSTPHLKRELFDAFVWLVASEETRRERLLAAGLPWEVVEGRLAAQRDLSPPKADDVYVVDAEGPLAEVATRVLNLLVALERENK
ncbi:MAG TPA: dephospho-CoA kinase [Candidatus Acetothermia bacterium]|nr:dephospho-CoA kinase [Candidatus Acetothermia bacterium]